MEKIRQRGQDMGPASRVTANRIRALREAIPFTLQEMAEELAKRGHILGLSALSKIETGNRRITVDDIFSLADVFGVTPGDLIPSPREKAYPPQESAAATAVIGAAATKTLARQLAELQVTIDRLRGDRDG